MIFTLKYLSDIEDTKQAMVDIMSGECTIFPRITGSLLKFELDKNKELKVTECTEDDSTFSSLEVGQFERVLQPYKGMSIYAKAKDGEWLVTDIVRLSSKNDRVLDYEQVVDFCDSFGLKYLKSTREVKHPSEVDFRGLDGDFIIKNFNYMATYEKLVWIVATQSNREE